MDPHERFCHNQNRWAYGRPGEGHIVIHSRNISGGKKPPVARRRRKGASGPPADPCAAWDGLRPVFPETRDLTMILWIYAVEQEYSCYIDRA